MCRYRARRISRVPAYGPFIALRNMPIRDSGESIERSAQREEADCGVQRRQRGAAPRKRGWTVYARSTTVQAQTSSIDDGIAHMRDELMPELENLDGYVGISLLADRDSGRCIITAAYETEDAMRASADKATQLRNRAAEKFGGSVDKIEHWEIGVLHRDHQS